MRNDDDRCSGWYEVAQGPHQGSMHAFPTTAVQRLLRCDTPHGINEIQRGRKRVFLR